MKSLLPAFVVSVSLAIILGNIWPVSANLLDSSYSRNSLSSFGPAPSFSLKDQTGEIFSSTEIKGPWLFNIFFSSCNGPCPATLAHLKRLSKKIGPEHPLSIISVSVDPGQDTPQTLAKYANKNSLSLPRWRFLTGELKEINQTIEEGFKIGTMDEPRFHSTRLILVDSKNEIRGYYMGADPEEVNKLIADIAKFL